MKLTKLVKRVCSLALTVSLLAGMMSVMGAFPMPAVGETQSETKPADKFVADFSELVALGGEAITGDGYATAYTPSTDTTSVDGKLINWMRERFATKINYVYSTYRSWFGQLSDEISDKEEATWGHNGPNTGFRVHADGLRLLVDSVVATEMLRRVDTIIPQFNGENVQLKNFKMTIKYRTNLQNYRGAIVVGFDETDAGNNIAHTNGYYTSTRRMVTGATLVLGNGSGVETRGADNGAAERDGWVFYNRTEIISATTVDDKYNTGFGQELVLGEQTGDYTVANGNVMYERFNTDSTQQWLTLTVEVKNGKATFTTTSEDGYRNETMEMDYNPRGGFVSIGMSGRDYVINRVDVVEYDDQGNEVDFGTYHNQKNYGIDEAVEVFSADFTDLPELHYVNGQYLYNPSHGATSAQGVGLTNKDSTTASTVGAYADAYDIDVRDKALVDYLESKFDFFVYSFGGGNTMERWNVAGYYVDAEGNHLGKDYGSNGYTPATGIGPDQGSWMAGNGVNGGYASRYPTIKVTGNKWLQLMSNEDGGWVEPFQLISYMKVKNADGSDAVLKNFKLDLDFKLAVPVDENNLSPIFVKFGGHDSVSREATDGAMFAISYNGGYFLDDLNTTVNGSTFMSTNNGGAPYYTETANSTAITEAHLTLTVKDGTVTAVVTADGTEILNKTKNDINIQSGLIQIGATYAGDYNGMPHIGAVKVTRLDNDGNPIDFPGDEDAFSASFVGLTDVVDACYYRNLGTKNNSITTGKSNPWLENAVGIASTKDAGNTGYAFEAKDPNVVDYLNEKFDFYHAASDGTLTKMTSPYQNADEICLDSFGGGQWKLAGGRWLRATFTDSAYWTDAYRKQMILVPKEDGKAIEAADLSVEFDMAHGLNGRGSYSAALVMLRSGEIAKTQSAAGDYTDGIAVRITHLGISVYDGTVPANTNGHTGDDQFLYGSDIYNSHVSLDLNGNELKVKVTSLDGATTYVDETVTVSNCMKAGYTYLSVCNSDIAFADISIGREFAENYLAAPAGLSIQKGKIVGLSAKYAYEYKAENAEGWLPVELGTTEIVGLDTSLVYQVRFAATDIHAAGVPVTLEYIAYDKGNTVQYNFNNADQLGDFDTWFVPTLTDNNLAVKTTGTANTNWYVEGGILRYKGSDLWNDPSLYHGGVEFGGQYWQCGYANVYNSNMGIAVLKTKQYKNFILDLDFTGSPYWTSVGFGANNTADGVYWNTANSGYNFLLESRENEQGGMNFYYRTVDGLQAQSAPNNIAYDGAGEHHMRVTVTGNKAYISVDDKMYWSVDVPASYEGGYIYFALNNTSTQIDNVQIVDLDAKAIEITDLARPIEPVEIDRASGETLHGPAVVYGMTANGFEYPLLMDLVDNEDYRSYKDETFTFGLTLKSMQNVSLANGFTATASVVNKVDYDATTSRKYYFDHPNDLKDFNGYYSKFEERADYWPNENDPGRNNYWSAFDGNLVAMDDPERQWVVSDNAVTTTYWGGNGGASAVSYMSNLSTLMYQDHQLINFRLEYDVKKGVASWWYNYSIIGVQDPTKYVYQLHTYEASLSTGEETANKTYEYTKDAGVYAFLEQEGYFNIFGNIQGGGSDRVNKDVVTIDGDAYDFIANYDRDAWHHVVVEVVDGVMKWTVDDSFTLYYELDYNAYGGYVGLGTYGTYSQFDNFQITALDENGNAVNIDTAEQGWAKEKDTIVKPSGWVPNDEFVWAN